MKNLENLENHRKTLYKSWEILKNIEKNLNAMNILEKNVEKTKEKK